ncbi:MAG: hypothetical protein AYK18_14610 [Theionarchaea archaeon DG-70]|nr:MAG: hypothetical protein AYK18_14610 [Theionarchaea archaeon DG-70]
MDQDSRGDVIVAVITMESDYHSYEIFALNGQDGTKIWSTKHKGSGYFEWLISKKINEDSVPDILAFGSNLVLFDGKNGKKIWEVNDNSIVAKIHDIDHDGNNEVITNEGIYDGIDGEKIGKMATAVELSSGAIEIADITGDEHEDIIFGYLTGVAAFEISFPNKEQELAIPRGEFQITTNPNIQQFPGIYGDIVVWQDDRNGNYDIYGYNLFTEEEFQITTDKDNQEMPAIFSNIVVWQDDRNGNYDIYGYNLSTKEEFQITVGLSDQKIPAIHKNIVVWKDNWDICGYNLTTKEKFQISGFASTKEAPAIYGDIVVWQDDRNANYDIYGINLLTYEELQIATNIYDQLGPEIYENFVIWTDERNGNWDIYGYNLLTKEEFQITTGPSDQEAPAICGDIVIWADERNGNYDIFGYNLSAGREFYITTNPSDQGSPTIYGDIVVWADYRNGNLDIYGYILSKILPPPTSTTISNNPIFALIITLVGILLAFFGVNYEKVKMWLRIGSSKPLGTPEKDEKKPTIFKFDFDIAISFAGEDRKIAKELAKKLRIKNTKVFYDEFYKDELWGKDLTKYFQDAYGPKTRFVIPLLSKYYPVTDWTDFEFSIMREEAEKRKTEFILPVRLDDTKIEGIKDDIAYLDYQKEGIDGVVDCLLEKLSKPPWWTKLIRNPIFQIISIISAILILLYILVSLFK